MRYGKDENSIELQMNNSGDWYSVNAKRLWDEDRFKIQANIADNISSYTAYIDNGTIALFLDTGKLSFEVVQPKFVDTALGEMGGSAGSRVVAPMPGVLEKVLVKPGDRVRKGDNLAVLIGEFWKFAVNWNCILNEICLQL